MFAIAGKKAIHTLQYAFAGEFFHRVSAERSGDKKAQRRPGHGAYPRQRAAPKSPEQGGVGKGDQKGGKRGDNRLQNHQREGDQRRLRAPGIDKTLNSLLIERSEGREAALHKPMYAGYQPPCQQKRKQRNANGYPRARVAIFHR